MLARYIGSVVLSPYAVGKLARTFLQFYKYEREVVFCMYGQVPTEEKEEQGGGVIFDVTGM